MASGDLFRAFTVRFSFKKEQHVRLLKKFEDGKLPPFRQGTGAVDSRS